mgnify:CR=1 FL=1
MLYATVRQRKIYVKAPITVIRNGVNVDTLILDMDDEWQEMTSIVCVLTWEDICYKQGFRIIPDTITAGLAFAKGEKGWWGNDLYESLLESNVWTPAAYPSAWQKVNN